MEPILIPSLANRLVIPTDPSEDEFNYCSSGITIDSYEIISTIGSGSYGSVYLVREKSNGNVYALKKIYYVDVHDSELVKKRAIRERDAMIVCNKAKNSRAPKLHRAFIDKDECVFYYVMDYIGGGDFNSYCYKRLCEQKPFTMDEIKFYMAELVICIETFHHLGLIHRDVKPENIMINEEGHLILCDYGSSKQLFNNYSTHNGFLSVSSSAPGHGGSFGSFGSGSFGSSGGSFGSGSFGSGGFSNTPPNFTSFLRNPSSSYTSYIGTPQYMAVEVVQGTNYSKLCDYWSLGAILFELCTGQALFVESPDTTEQKIRENIGNWRGLLNTAISKNQSIPKVVETLIRDLIAPERKRIDSMGIRKHPFFEGINWEDVSNHRNTPPFKPTLNSSTDTTYFRN